MDSLDRAEATLNVVFGIEDAFGIESAHSRVHRTVGEAGKTVESVIELTLSSLRENGREKTREEVQAVVIALVEKHFSMPRESISPATRLL